MEDDFEGTNTFHNRALEFGTPREPSGERSDVDVDVGGIDSSYQGSALGVEVELERQEVRVLKRGGYAHDDSDDYSGGAARSPVSLEGTFLGQDAQEALVMGGGVVAGVNNFSFCSNPILYRILEEEEHGEEGEDNEDGADGAGEAPGQG